MSNKILVGGQLVDTASKSQPDSREFRDHWIVNGDVIETDLSGAKGSAHKVRYEWFQWKAFAAANPVYHSGKEFWSDRDSCNLINGEVDHARGVEEDSPGSYTSSGWKSIDGSLLPITDFAAIKALKAAYRNHMLAAFNASQAKAAEIESAANTDDLLLIVQGMRADIES